MELEWENPKFFLFLINTLQSDAFGLMPYFAISNITRASHYDFFAMSEYVRMYVSMYVRLLLPYFPTPILVCHICSMDRPGISADL